MALAQTSIKSKNTPDDKLYNYGSASLTDVELLAVLLRTGNKNQSVTELSEAIIAQKDSGITGLCTMNYKELIRLHGVGHVKALQILAIKEIATRISKNKAIDRFHVTSPSSIANVFMGEMRFLDKEHIKCVFLDTKNGIIDTETVSIGTANSSLLEPREVFKSALMHKALSIILLHNHPSGNPKPSADDIEVTKRIVQAGRLIGIELLDHIIIGDTTFISMKEEGIGMLI